MNGAQVRQLAKGTQLPPQGLVPQGLPGRWGLLPIIPPLFCTVFTEAFAEFLAAPIRNQSRSALA